MVYSTFFQLDLSTGSNQVVVEDDDFCYTATYLDLDQVSPILPGFQCIIVDIS